MNSTNQQVEVFMVGSFLLKNHSYKIVTIQHHSDELWLANPTNTEFPVIRVSATNTEAVFFDRNRIMENHKAICKAIKREARLLDLHISSETEVETDPDFEQVVLNKGVIYGKNIAHYFPLIKNAITPFTDPDAEMRRISADVEEFTKEKARKKKNIRKQTGIFKYLNVSTVVVAICVLMYAIVHILANMMNYSEVSMLMALGAYWENGIVINHEYWRFLTVGLHHGSIWHLLMNMMALLNMGPALEQIYGQKKFIILLLFSTFTGSALMYALGDSIFAVGLSGGLYGCMAAYFVYAYTRGMFRIPAFKNQMIRMLMINLMINFMPNIAVSAHIGGFIGGLLIAFLFVQYEPWKQMKKNAAIAAVVILLFLGYRGVTLKRHTTIYQNDYDRVQIYNDLGMDWYGEHVYSQLIQYNLSH